MWRTAAARRLRSASTSLPVPRSSSISQSPVVRGGGFAGIRRLDALLAVASVHSASGSWKNGSDAVSVGSAVTARGFDFAKTIRHYGQCYFELSKAKLSALVVATSGAGFVLGSGSTIDVAALCCTCAGTMMVAASASTLNQVFEVKNDIKMKRTQRRPLPSQRISAPHAAMWATTVGVAGTTLLAWQTNNLAAGLAASNLVLYAFVYTPLKQIHPINTWVGAIVGAIPPLLGWAAASSELTMGAMVLPAALYFWQLPHFMALAYLCRNDYVAGGFRMLSFADPSGQRTALVSSRNCLYLLPLGLLAYNWGLTSHWFAIESSLLTLGLSVSAMSFVSDRTAKSARRMFHASLLYLPVFMSALLLHRVPNDEHHNLSPKAYEVEAVINSELLEAEEPRKITADRKPRPPVSYASIAPFPFLPVPVYASDS